MHMGVKLKSVITCHCQGLKMLALCNRLAVTINAKLIYLSSKITVSNCDGLALICHKYTIPILLVELSLT